MSSSPVHMCEIDVDVDNLPELAGSYPIELRHWNIRKNGNNEDSVQMHECIGT